MVSKELCRRCKYRSSSKPNVIHCGYLLVTGHSRLAQTDPAAPDICPVYEPGKPLMLDKRHPDGLFDTVERHMLQGC